MKTRHVLDRTRILVLCIVATWLQQAIVIAQGDPSIVPGKGVGVLRLGMDKKAVEKSVSPSEPSNQGPASKPGEWVQIYMDLGMKFYFTNDILERIIVINPKLIVRGLGIHVGDDYSEVAAKRNEFNKMGIDFIPSENKRKIVAIVVMHAK